MSNTGLTELDVNSPRVVESDTIPTAFRLRKVSDKKPKAHLPVTTQFPLYKQQLESLNQRFIIEGEDVGLTRIALLGKGKEEEVLEASNPETTCHDSKSIIHF
jgi:hypothetical protein